MSLPETAPASPARTRGITRRGSLLLLSAAGLLGWLGLSQRAAPRLRLSQRVRRARLRLGDTPPGFFWIGHC